MPPPAPPPKPGYGKDVKALVLLALLIAFHLWINLHWLRTDNHLVALDEAHHVDRSAAYDQALYSPGKEGFFARALAALGIESPYPPLAHVAGALCMRFFGNTPDAAALSGSASLALLLLGVYLLARQGMAAHNAFLAALVTSFTPMIYGYSRLVMPDTLCVALVVWALFGLVKSDLFRKTGWTVLLGIATGLALLTKQTALLYLALPLAGAFLAGFARAVMPVTTPPGVEPQRRWPKVLSNGALCMLIVLSLCSWWYLKHLDFLYTWWSTQRGGAAGIFQPGVAFRLEGVLPQAMETPETRIALDTALSQPVSTPIQAGAAYPFTSLLRPFRLYWARYLLYFINEVAFLPLALVALAGIPMVFLKRNRRVLLPLLFTWLAGTYLLLTGLFALNSPRFLCAIAPAAAMLAVLAFDAVPLLRLRRALWGLFLTVLALQFVNISLAPFGGARRVEIPVCAGEPEVFKQGNSGLTVYKDTINTGRYSIHPPLVGQQATESVLEAMAAHEAARTAIDIRDGAALWYQVVSPVIVPLGMDFYAKRRPLPPVSQAPRGEDAGGEGEAEGKKEEEVPRRFAPIKAQSMTCEGTLPELAETRYVILFQPLADNFIQKLEESVLFFLREGFESLYSRAADAYGAVPPGYIHVLARKDFPKPDDVKDLFDLYDMLDRDGKTYLLAEEDRTRLEQRYAEEVLRYTEVRPLNDQVNLLGFHVKAVAENWFLVRLIVHAAETPGEDLRVWMRATPREVEKKDMFPVQQVQPFLTWDFSPEPPSTSWKRNQALVLTRPVMAHPLHYQVKIGLYDPGKEDHPRTTSETEWLDFSATD